MGVMAVRRRGRPGRDEEAGPGFADRVLGCLLGGAVGDALGAEVEFDSIDGIRVRFGRSGLTGYADPKAGGRITDDTQMTLFTAEGLIRSSQRLGEPSPSQVTGALHRAYLRWLFTQTGGPVPWDEASAGEPSGWLVAQPQLHARRAPGNTCLSALAGGQAGAPDRRINDSKGCGGVMRVAPVGLVAAAPFRLGVDAAALTHTHPSGYLAAGAFAEIIGRLVHGETLLRGIAAAQRQLPRWDGHEETALAIDAAVDLAVSEPEATPETVSRLGEGWVAEEALAISLYCALTARSFEAGVLAAVNHSGDSDSTGAITGNLLGTRWGIDAVPPEWLDGLAERALVERVALDLVACAEGSGPRPAGAWERYPPG